MDIKNKLNVWKYENYAPWYRLDKKIRGFFQKIKWTWQRAKYGYCDRDTWGLDYTLGNYIANTVKHLAETTHGYPHGTSEESWKEILISIAENFYLGCNEDLYENEYEEKINSNLFTSKTKGNKELWRLYSEREREITEKMSLHRREGFKELEKWFPHLWD